ncbi:MAG: putative ABC transporter ATP-binding protein YheS [candidate division Hyd24-12 bacterium ADurb.Bin004]|nr:MAG: putative ABC transporter ATP-binding protein YheS [candidate division Hyd24-12 bacterium ADurb.Bin004]
MIVHAGNLGVSFGEDEIFSGLNFSIERGDRTALVGVNGAGKTTLFRVMAGLMEPTEGTFVVARGIRVGYLPQEMTEFPTGPLLSRVMFHSDEIRKALSIQHRLHEDLSGELDGEEEKTSLQKLGEASAVLESAGFYDLEHRAARLLGGLGFRQEEMDKPLDLFSGGWRMRAELAALLLAAPDLLLLDEPTNHLDLDARLWLEEYLRSFNGAVWMISHDPAFLDKTVNRVCEIEFGRLNFYRGGYSRYEELKTEEIREREKQAGRQAEQRERYERFINKFRSNPRKRNLVQSRIKMLERMEVIETHRSPSRMRIRFPEVPRGPEKVLELTGVSKKYDRTIFQGVDLVVGRGDRIGIVGRNGEGKSTLSRIMAGIEEPTEGSCRTGPGVLLGYYSQEIELALDRELSVIDQVATICPERSQGELRSYLGMFLFTGDEAFKKTSVLSGGEKSRVALARLLMTPLNLLILDEPTNHLDIFSREVLEEALRDYRGTLILVSHDEKLLSSTVETIYEVERGRVRPFAGSFAWYVEKKQKELEAGFGEEKRAEAQGPSQRDLERQRKRAEAEERNRLYKKRLEVEKRMQRVEKELIPLEEKMKGLESMLCDPEVLSDGRRVVELQKEHAWLADRVNSLQEKWNSFAEEHERLSPADG